MQTTLRLLSKSYFNEWKPGILTFFDTSANEFGKLCILNQSKYITDPWKFDWLDLTPHLFKNKLKQQTGSDA